MIEELIGRIENCEKCIKNYEQRIREITNHDTKLVMFLAEKIEKNEVIIDRLENAIRLLEENK